MENTIKLEWDLTQAENNTDLLEQKAESVETLLEDAYENLEKSKRINRNLRELNDSLNTAAELLLIVSIVPTIGSAASKARTTINNFNKPIAKARKVSDRIEQKVVKIREFIRKCEKKAEELDDAILEINNKENRFISVIGNAQSCVISLPESDAKEKLESSLETVSAKLDPVVKRFDAVQLEMLKNINSAEKKLSDLTPDLKKLVEIDKALSEAKKIIAPVIIQLRAIAKAFKQTIRVPYGGWPKMCKKSVWGVKVYYPCGWHTEYFSFTIKQILNGVKGVIKPVMDLLNKAMNAILNPLLKALDLNIKLPEIPDLNKLQSIFNNLDKVLQPVEQIVDDLQKQFVKYAELVAEIEKSVNEIKTVAKKCLRAVSI